MKLIKTIMQQKVDIYNYGNNITRLRKQKIYDI
jgi:hypothetical protein